MLFRSLGNRILKLLPEDGCAGILGLSYKPDTDVVDESQGLLLARYLLDQGCSVVVYDPVAMDNARKRLDGRVTYAASMQDCAAQAHVLAVTTAWDEFKGLRPEHLNRSAARVVVVDCWRMLARAEFEAVADVVTLGHGPEPAQVAEVAGIGV